MPSISVLSPLDQPLGKRRLLEDLKRCLNDPELDEFGFSVAFSKVGPLYRLQELIKAWRLAGKKASGIFGIDHKGTSLQALRFALDHLDGVFYTQHIGNSFHPKVYWFRGNSKAVGFIGSNNMTMGGMELNFEAAIELQFKLPDEQADFDQIHKMFSSLLPASCAATRKLTAEALAQLEGEELLLDETRKSARSGWAKQKMAHPPSKEFGLLVKPASSLPPHLIFGKTPRKRQLAEKAGVLKLQADVIDVLKPLVPVSGIAMQIKPHHNGEIFLSRIAARQNPAFFGMPFTSQTRPKKGKNESYPQREPDPACNIVVFGKDNETLYSTTKYLLNMVFYQKNSEIRVTASPLVPHVPEYSVIVITPSEDAEIDYEMKIFTPASPSYAKWVAVCNQKMPGGGKRPRWFGWF